MQVVGNARLRSENFNGVSEKLKSELIPKVQPGDILNFQLLNGVYDAALGREAFGASRSIPLRDRIYDKYAQDETGKEVGAYVEIGVPETINNGRVERCKKFWVESVANGIPGNGEFQLMADSIQDMEIFEILCLSNGNVNNPFRDKTKSALYKRVDVNGMRKEQADKDFKELQAKLKLFAKQNPEQASKLSEHIPVGKETTTA